MKKKTSYLQEQSIGLLSVIELVALQVLSRVGKFKHYELLVYRQNRWVVVLGTFALVVQVPQVEQASWVTAVYAPYSQYLRKIKWLSNICWVVLLSHFLSSLKVKGDIKWSKLLHTQTIIGNLLSMRIAKFKNSLIKNRLHIMKKKMVTAVGILAFLRGCDAEVTCAILQAYNLLSFRNIINLLSPLD